MLLDALQKQRRFANATRPDQTDHAIVPVDFVVHISVEFIIYAFQLTIHVLIESLHEAPPFKSHYYSAILTRNRTIVVRFIGKNALL